MKLDCLLDTCPKNHRSVSMLDCCGKYSSSKPCQFYGATPWSEFAEVTCLHSEATKAHEKTREANREAFKASIGVAHIIHVGR